MVTYWELDALESLGLFHNDPTDPHSASSQIDVDCALATAVDTVRRTTAGAIIFWQTDTRVFMAFILFDRMDAMRAPSQRSCERAQVLFEPCVPISQCTGC